MTSSLCRKLILFLIGCSCASVASAQDARKPLADSELMALAAGKHSYDFEYTLTETH